MQLSDHLCECGCGQFTGIIQQTDKKRGRIRGEATRFLPGHFARVATPLFSEDTLDGKMRTAVLKLYKQHQQDGTLPTSGRFLYYELITSGDVLKTEHEAGSNRVTKALTKLREEGFIEWDDITDETRSLTDWQSYPSIKDGIRSAWRTAQVDIWQPDKPPMIICESRSLKAVLENLAYEYQIPIAATNGQCGGFLHHTIAPALTEGQTVLYFGDLDHQGEDIEGNTTAVLQHVVGALDWRRVAITQSQADDRGIEPIMKRDGRFGKKVNGKREGKLHPAIETEALGQAEIVRLLRGELRRLMPAKRMKKVQKAAEIERRKLGRKLGFGKVA